MDLLQQYWQWLAAGGIVMFLLWNNRDKLLAWWPERTPEPVDVAVELFVAWRAVRKHLSLSDCTQAVRAMDTQIFPSMMAGEDVGYCGTVSGDPPPEAQP